MYRKEKKRNKTSSISFCVNEKKRRKTKNIYTYIYAYIYVGQLKSF